MGIEKPTTERYKEYKKLEKVGKFDISKYTNEIETTTKDVILTEKQKEHILERHPEMKEYIKEIPKILKDPDLIFKQLDKEDTLWVIKKYEDNLKITLKLNTINNEKEIGYKNSIIQMQFIREKELNRNIKNSKIIKIFEKIMKK